MNYHDPMTTDPTPTVDAPRTFTVTLNGRDIVFTALNEMQAALVAQWTYRLKRGEGTDLMKTTARLLNMIQAAAVNEDDREFMEDSMAAGKIRITDLEDWFRQGVQVGNETPANGPVQRVRRARK